MMNTTNVQGKNEEIYSDLLEPAMTGPLKYTLMNDFLAKYSLQNDLYALGGLLGALLHIDPESITAIQILNPVEPGSVITDKNCVLDIKLELNGMEIINIEIQTRRQDFWPERSLTYLCRNFDHLKEGESYLNIKPCIQIGILDNDLFKKEDPRYTDEFFVEYKLLSTSKHTAYTGKFQIKVLLLNHLNTADEREKSTPNGLYFWAKLFKAQSWEDLKMIAKDNPRMESFVGTVRKLTAEEKVALACEARRRYSNEIATYEGSIKDLEKREQEALNRLEEAQNREKEANSRAEEANSRAEETLLRLEEVKRKAEAERQELLARIAQLQKEQNS